MTEEKVSIIIPVYNVEKYIEECLHSAINQTYENIEIIVVDDGSVDNSYTLCRKYEKKYNNLKVYHINNIGVSGARNFGIKKAIGDYIVFLDSDDIIENTMIEKLIQTKKKYHVDMVACSYYYMYKDKVVTNNLLENKILKLQQSKYEIFKNNSIQGFSVNKLFNRYIIVKNNLYFDEDIKIWEDLLFVFKYIQYCREIFILNEPLYYYRMRKSSTLNKNSTSELSIFDAINKMYLIDPNVYKYMSVSYYYIFFKYYKVLKKNNLLNNVKKVNIKDLLDSKDLSIKEKIICLIYRIFPNKILVSLKRRNKKNYFD